MELRNVDDFKKAIGYSAGQDLTEEMIKIIPQLLSKMNPDLAMKVVSEIPELKDYAVNSLVSMEKDYQVTVESSNKGLENSHLKYVDIRRIYGEELKRDDLPIEVRTHLHDLIMETGDKESEDTKEHHNFLFGLFNRHNANKLAFLVAGFFVAAVALRSNEEKDDDNKEKDNR